MVKVVSYEVGCASPGWTLRVNASEGKAYVGLEGWTEDAYLPICVLSYPKNLPSSLAEEAIKRAFDNARPPRDRWGEAVAEELARVAGEILEGVQMEPEREA